MSSYQYNIGQTDTRVKEFFESSTSTYQFYKRICDLVGGFVVSSKNYFVVEIDEEANFHLVKDMTNKLMTTIIKRRHVEKKERHGYKLSNLFVTIKVYK